MLASAGRVLALPSIISVTSTFVSVLKLSISVRATGRLAALRRGVLSRLAGVRKAVLDELTGVVDSRAHLRLSLLALAEHPRPPQLDRSPGERISEHVVQLAGDPPGLGDRGGACSSRASSSWASSTSV